jgi:hypothetical protein
MRTAVAVALTSIALAGCGSGASDPGAERLALLVAPEPIAIKAPTTVLVQIVVLGANGEAVSVEAQGLPGFASLSGSVVTLSPALADAGDYAILLTATAGRRQDSATLRLHVTRDNTAPMWAPVPMMQDASRSIRDFDGVTIAGTPYLDVEVCDRDGDAMTLHAEFVPAGAPFTGVATHTFAAIPSQWLSDRGCAFVFAPISDLPVPGTYDFRLLVVDALGAEDPYGWVQFGRFSRVP